MDEPDACPRTPPHERSATPTVVTGAFVFAGGLALLLLLYIGSFTVLVVDGRLGWGVFSVSDPQTQDLLLTFYHPLVWLVFGFPG